MQTIGDKRSAQITQLVRWLCVLFLASGILGCGVAQKFHPSNTEEILFLGFSGSGNWQQNWFLDGERAQLRNTENGLEFSAGPEAGNDTCHAVLWTKQVFSGDLRISYDYTRLDTSTRFVNILYFMATGESSAAYPTDISSWNEKRVVPHMRTYFNHMRAYHISYATYGPDAGSATDDYIRLRRYDPTVGGLRGTDIAPDYFETGLFKPGVTYHVEVTKRAGMVTMQITNKSNAADQLFCTWDISQRPSYGTGRIGLRHMYTRGARYGDFRVVGLK